MLGSNDRRLELNRFILLKSRGGETRGMLLFSIVLLLLAILDCCLLSECGPEMELISFFNCNELLSDFFPRLFVSKC